MSILVTGGGVQSVSESLDRDPHNGASLELIGSLAPTASSYGGPWTVEIDNIGAGRVCTPHGEYVSNGGSTVTRLSPQKVSHPAVQAFVGDGPLPYRTVVQSTDFMYVKLCWSRSAPVNLNGSYLSAQFPTVTSSNSAVLAVTRTLSPDAAETADFVIQSQVQPTSSTLDSWQWSVQVPPADSIRLSAVNISGTQHDTYRAFLSGIVFGIAGGALISLVTELVAPLSRRRAWARTH
jgi:hypothetical protein